MKQVSSLALVKTRDLFNKSRLDRNYDAYESNHGHTRHKVFQWEVVVYSICQNNVSHSKINREARWCGQQRVMRLIRPTAVIAV